MPDTVLSTLPVLSPLLLVTAPPDRISIFLFTVNETDPENQNKLPIVTQLKSNKVRIQMQLCLGSQAVFFPPKLQR